MKGIDWQWVVPANIISDNLNITPFAKNVFIATGHGNDAIDVSKTNGTNILDGSTGSNFMTGGTGDDLSLWMIEARPTRSGRRFVVRTPGDDVTIWGLTQSDFQQMKMGNDVLPIAPGLDFALSQAGKPDVNVTLTGFFDGRHAQRQARRRFGHTQDTPGLAGSDYMLVHANSAAQCWRLNKPPHGWPFEPLHRGACMTTQNSLSLAPQRGSISMRIAAQYSHLNGYEFLLVHQKERCNLIEQIIADVDAQQFRTKVSRRKPCREGCYMILAGSTGH